MQNESLAMVPRKDRPFPESLEGYERRFPFDPDYTAYRTELGDWLHDYRRDQDENRERESGKPSELSGHEQLQSGIDGARVGFDEDNFDLSTVVRTVGSRPRH